MTTVFEILALFNLLVGYCQNGLSFFYLCDMFLSTVDFVVTLSFLYDVLIIGIAV